MKENGTLKALEQRLKEIRKETIEKEREMVWYHPPGRPDLLMQIERRDIDEKS